MSFGKRMQTRREELGLSQLALAKRLGVSQSTIGNYEAGISFPKEEILLRLFDCLETDPNALFRDSFRGGGEVLSASERRMLDQYRGTGWKKFFLIFGMCDESFSIHCTATPPEGVDRSWFLFFITLLNYAYWVGGATLGSLAGSLVTFDTTGLDFVMPALFLVIFLNQWMSEKRHLPTLVGLGASLACRLLFGADRFILPAMAAILALLTVARPRLEAAETKEDSLCK